MVNRTVLIAGAGIGGPALAFWLRRHGFTSTVVEVAPAPRPGGHAVDLRGAGREVVERMGLLDTVRAESVDERGFAYVDRRGRWTTKMPADLFDGEGMVAEIEIMRGDLARILHDATRDGTEYLFDDRIAELTEDGDGVKVTFASGTVRRFDIVVGADGLHSGVRQLVFGPEQEFVRHLGGYMAYFTVPDPGDLDNWFLMHGAPGGLVAGIRPENGGTAKAMLAFTSPPLTYDRRDVLAQQQILRAKFTGAGWLVPQMLAAMPGAGDFYFDSLSQVHIGQWHRGRTVLLGDAGYCGSPLAGLGTSLALVAAYVLAGELAATPDDHKAAFARYQDEMRGYVKQCQTLPPGGMKSFAPNSALMIRMRNVSMTMMTRWPLRALAAKQFQKADAITLKDY
ncbi:FAD-dependent monooxygenase [Actinocrispum wychmicini]|uniref:2-polyprenyl-6-methoxyphenol hydroxylase-like FAD-dependent oxidoreductase n=1 Tax=Actinocrispum wychmicini TaxID=1213861 RepID=A0A4R2JLR7_9PSEU|nr:FAD-dependent monooxygenase [Actinocrispum wychmicini]TCO59542.1 2-polyprenyl-6-methoxyphenol hydroxylase-like FAD-dependent oxidoreductase [Actinocrispum wychmicini]